jgi:2-C-methyl-D-erythritol 4-phosphate cytidylyltransferase/2-C-methyl-D-erythritol 4-phosphate cytidylyltransferase/2-C-methyl-D-erythritol 2,4-cyclodiphosphate synthase
MGGVKKEYCPLPGTDKTVLAAAVSAFSVFPCIANIVITVPEAASGSPACLPEARGALPSALLEAERPKIIFVPGGETRRASVYKALSALREYRPCYVLIHDGSRPWVSPALIRRMMEAVQQYQAVIPLLPLIETPKELFAPAISGGPDAFGSVGAVVAVEASVVEGAVAAVGASAAKGASAAATEGSVVGLGAEETGSGLITGPVYIKRHLRRSFIGTAQTPQAFAFPEILLAHEKAAQKEIEYTDDAEVWGEFIGPVAVVPGAPENRKITFPEDLKMEELC